ncbi:hypothetical protein BDP27DRAFT_1315541 [Rhodocollybia butyracea]|uniref:Uncharacterized protein n=1 Tax=Rhodocollybia butyracea TaxID=206335 RepID=A0A9P5UCG8_9AGAR|nr:hypothetical protein BDP27DRAFT_1315541 [Rhodocollybia butyracea]
MWRLSQWAVPFITLLSCQAVAGVSLTIMASQASSTASTSVDSGLASETSSVPDSKGHTTTTLAIVLSILGTLFLVTLGIVVGCHFMRKRKGSLGRGSGSKLSRASSLSPTIASFVAGYSPDLGHGGYKELPNPPTPPYISCRSISPGSLTVSTSSMSIPHDLYVSDFTNSSSANTISPAMQSSNMAMAEERLANQKRWKLVPLRRAESDAEERVTIQKRWRLLSLPLRRLGDA